MAEGPWWSGECRGARNRRGRVRGEGIERSSSGGNGLVAGVVVFCGVDTVGGGVEEGEVVVVVLGGGRESLL